MRQDVMALARSLHAFPDEDLRILLSRRPEAAEAARRPHPGWMDLAAALLRPRALALTLPRLDRFLGQVLELTCLEGGRLTREVAAAEGLAPADLDAAVRELRRWGLAAADGDGALVVPPVVTDMVWDPGHLGVPAARLLANLTVAELRPIAMLHGRSGATLPTRKTELTEAIRARLADRDAIRALLAAAPPGARADLEALRRAGGTNQSGRAGKAWEQPYYAWSTSVWMPRRDTSDGAGWLVARGLVLPEDEQKMGVALPAEVERAARPRVFGRWDVASPALEVAPLREKRHPVDLIIAMDTLLEDWRHAPPPALKDGGAPKREIKRAAQRIGWTEDEAGQLVALAGAAGLLRERELVPEKRSRSWRHPHVLQSRRAVVEPSAEAERWLALPEADRWLELARVWLRSIGADGAGRGAGPSRERLVLEHLAGIADGKGAGAVSIGAALSWRHPGVFSDADAAALARSVGHGLALLGAGTAEPVVGIDAVGRLAVLSDGAVDPAALQSAFPAVADRCVVTADHRIVVSGPPHGELARLLRRIAEVVSVRPARVYRITGGSLGRALDGGLTAPAILETLRRHASEPIPPNVVTLVEDVAQRHGRLRVGSADVYVVADDPAQLEAVARDRAVGGGRLRRLAPTVAVIEGRDAGEVMAALRRVGLMPVADGAAPPVATPADAVRASPPAPTPRTDRARAQRAEPATLDAAGAEKLVAALRAAPRPAARAAGDAWPSPPREETVRVALAEAAPQRRRVELGYRSASGNIEILIVDPFQLQRDHVYVQDARRFSVFPLELRRILWVETPRERNGSHRAPALAKPLFGDADDDLLDADADEFEADDDLFDDDDDDALGEADRALLEADRIADERASRATRRRR